MANDCYSLCAKRKKEKKRNSRRNALQSCATFLERYSDNIVMYYLIDFAYVSFGVGHSSLFPQ